MNRSWTHFFWLWLLVCPCAGVEFGFNNLRELAQNLAAQPFKPAANEVPAALLQLNYDQYQSIQFKHKLALWRQEGLPFQLEFFLPGGGHTQTVALHEIEGERLREIAFDPNLFDPGTNRPVIPAHLGYAGFRIVQPAAGYAEVAAFLDASYFRMIGRGADYGTSGRGLALNTVAKEGEREEFPAFRQFWIRRPKPEDRELTVYTLMDSLSVVGAYQFNICPGTVTVAVVKAVLIPRREVREFGIAPLTSMFLFGKNGHLPFSDFRPEVHDADGLLIHNGCGEWIWRPLDAGKMMRVDSFQDDRPRGFGLMQRERDFENYQDLVARYQCRPSVWVQPIGNWGKGCVELVQLASEEEYFDDVVAFWRPAKSPNVGQALNVAYELHWTTANPSSSDLGHVRATRIGRTSGKPPRLRFVVDFDGAAVESLAQKANITANIRCGDATAPVAVDVFKNQFNQTWRLVFEVVEPRQAVNLQAFLEQRGRPTTETWNYTWQP